MRGGGVYSSQSIKKILVFWNLLISFPLNKIIFIPSKCYILFIVTYNSSWQTKRNWGNNVDITVMRASIFMVLCSLQNIQWTPPNSLVRNAALPSFSQISQQTYSRSPSQEGTHPNLLFFMPCYHVRSNKLTIFTSTI